MSKHVRIGVYLVATPQLLDTATIDILGLMSREYLQDAGTLVPKQFVDMAPSVSIVYITTPDQKDEVKLTASMTIKPHHTYLDEEVAPGKLDIIVVPGIDPTHKVDEAGGQWLKKHFETQKVDVLSVCTGIYICAAAGIVNGRRACGPRGMQYDLAKKYPTIDLVGHKFRWWQDGNFWSAGKSLRASISHPYAF